MKRFITLLLVAPMAVVAPVAMAQDTTTTTTTSDDVKLEDLPKPVRDTVEREVKKGQITEIEREEDRGKTFYEVEFLENNKRMEIHVSPEGKLLKRKAD